MYLFKEQFTFLCNKQRRQNNVETKPLKCQQTFMTHFCNYRYLIDHNLLVGRLKLWKGK